MHTRVAGCPRGAASAARLGLRQAGGPASALARPEPPSRPMACRAASRMAASKRPIILFDVMDTIVYDPFFKEMPRFFNMSFQDLLKAKHPSAWVEFECNRISEEQLIETFFADGRPVDGPGLRQMLISQYRYLDGMESLLARLSAAGYEMHAMSNYPVWWQLIENKLQLSKYLDWTFVSCTGPMEGVRKPAPEAYQRVLDHLRQPGNSLVFIDDREVNTKAAEAAGIPSLLFKGAAQLEQDLKARGIEL